MASWCTVIATVLFVCFSEQYCSVSQDSPPWLDKRNTTVIGRPCPQEKECTCFSRSRAIHGTRVDCADRNLTAIPKHLPNDTSYLDLSNNTLAELGKFPFVIYPKIQILNMSGNSKIKFIGTNTFGKLENLTHLDLQNCGFSDVEAKAFECLPSLTYLDMSNNPYLTFRNLRNISYGLQYTRIKILKLNSIHPIFGPCNTITKNDIEYLHNTSITHIYLDFNKIATLDVEAVDYLPRSVETLSVKHNIFMIDIYMFYMHQNFPFPKLRKLIISDQGRFHSNEYYSWVQSTLSKSISSELSVHTDNESSSKTNLQESPHVEYKRAEDNGPTTLDFVLSETITYIDVSNSNLQLELGNIALATPNNLTYLLLNKNILWRLNGTFIGFDNLTFLDLSWNYCESISKTVLQNMRKLRHLNLSTNFLDYSLEKDVNGETFQSQTQLKTLDLTNNKIRKLPPGIFDSLIHLQVLNLSQNILIELHVRLDHMNKLKFLSLQKNLLETIPKSHRDTFDRLLQSTNLTLNIEHNRFKCSCNATHQEFLDWMIHTPVYFGNLSHISCFFDNGSTVTFSSREKLSQVYEALKKDCRSYL
ncbi:MAG: leucine-rich repeat domain-containing protein, partial [Candidatus Thiodiazotropha sp.]